MNAKIVFWVKDSVVTCLLVRNNVVAKHSTVAMQLAGQKECTDIIVVALVARSIGC